MKHNISLKPSRHPAWLADAVLQSSSSGSSSRKRLPAIAVPASTSSAIAVLYVRFAYSSLIKNPDVKWSDIPDFPKAACALLDDQFTRSSSTVLHCQQSAGADTTKLLIQLQDGMQVEAVVMHYDTSGVLGHLGASNVAVNSGCLSAGIHSSSCTAWQMCQERLGLADGKHLSCRVHM